MTTMDLVLDGTWDLSNDGRTWRPATVPGLAGDPAVKDAAPIRYRRCVRLPLGSWSHASLVLNGARFRPQVLIDGSLVAEAEGGMAPIQVPLVHPALRAGAEIELGIVLTPLDQVPTEDASRIPPADHWRSDVSAHLWDSVILRLHGPVAIRRVLPWPDLAADRLGLTWIIDTMQAIPHLMAQVAILDDRDRELLNGSTADSDGRLDLALGGRLRRWSPEDPACYRLRMRLLDGDGVVVDETVQTFGLRSFAVDGRGFRLNGQPVHLRAGTVVWHRWVRDPEGRHLAWDTAWFRRNILERLKHLGANCMRFHLGMPPESLLDLCDRLGLLVQAEWSFFHGLDGGPESLRRQWADWFALCLRHPSVVVHHPWNETDEHLLAKAYAAIEAIAPSFPPLVVSHRDVCHVHKYWWSMFENVGIYYDSVDDFAQPVMADEFGGNYLDGACVPGGYPTLRESFLRFLGRQQTPADRLRLHTDSNARIAEYWRRLGVAGFSNFCALGSWEDGNHHFLGALAEGRPKPVWEAMNAAWSSVSCSLDLWDRNFAPGARPMLSCMVFNDTTWSGEVGLCLRVKDGEGRVRWTGRTGKRMPAFARERDQVQVVLPDQVGTWELELEAVDAPGIVGRPISRWRVNTRAASVPAVLAGRRIEVPEDEPEIRAWCRRSGLSLVEGDGDLLLLGRASWNRLTAGDVALRQRLEKTIHAGCGVVMTDLGPLWLGEGYLPHDQQGNLQGSYKIAEPQRVEVALGLGVHLGFTELGEPESCLHPTAAGAGLLDGLDSEALRLWNGLKGGLILPAADLEVQGMCRSGVVAQWKARGAPEDLLAAGTCIAYELAGQYAFAAQRDPAVEAGLRQRVRFLIADAPALAVSINPEGRIRVHDVVAMVLRADGQAESLEVLAEAGRDLCRAPVLRLVFGSGRGRLILSQTITGGRLDGDFHHPDILEDNPHYALRTDPAAQRFLLNLMAMAVAWSG